MNIHSVAYLHQHPLAYAYNYGGTMSTYLPQAELSTLIQFASGAS